MDRKEAILRIKDHMEHHGIGKYPHLKLKEAFDMSIAALDAPNEPLTQADIDKMHFDRVWIDYGVDDSGERCGEEGVVLYGKLYAIDTLDGSAFDLLLDACDGETLDRPSGDYKVYCHPPEGDCEIKDYAETCEECGFCDNTLVSPPEGEEDT